MSIKGKLIGLVLLISLSLGLLAGYFLWASWHIRHQVAHLVPAIGYLRGIADTRINITRQMKEATDYLIAGAATDRAEYDRFGAHTLQALDLWQKSAQQQLVLGVKGEEGDLTRAAAVRSSYEDWEKLNLRLFAMVDAGERNQALKIFADRSDRLIEGSVLTAIDSALEDGQNKVQGAYHDLLMSTGMIPWLPAQTLQRIRGTQASIDYLLAVNRLSAGVNKQLKALLDFLLFGTDPDLLFFNDFGKETKSAIEACARAANRKAAIDPGNRDDLLQEVVTIEHSYGQVLALADQAIKLKRQGQTPRAFQLIVEDLDPLLDGGLMPRLAMALDDGGQEILRQTTVAGRRGVIVVCALSLLLVAVVIQLIRAILRPLRQLGTGIAVIAGGNLDYRIGLQTPDEFGLLAAQFDAMVDRLRHSRADVERLNSELEQRVEERTRQLETANRELQSFSYSVSHDLRTPLARISAHCHLLLADEESPDEATVRATLDRINDSTEEMEQLIQALLGLSRVGSEELHRGPVNLSRLAETLASELREREPQRQVEFRIAAHVVADGDRGLLQAALANLLGNAWKYSAKTEHSVIEFDLLPDARQRTYFVRDNGAGFDMSCAEQLFIPFRRLHETGEFDGTGIGLATVQRIVHRHGGRIWAKGAIGRGATFYFTLGEEEQPPA